ncbi:TraB/GumN family protein [Aliidiomarina halalkaliphila]|uniref:TraB/GumN family protein n=1 Tax=Aliidiomarina halalkaliphila TaxID=2593535 RepID=UPI00163D3FCC|nr:TraB/GumN family protein [Aliidiomarina halalkaliphila]
MVHGKVWLFGLFILLGVLIAGPTQAEISYLAQRDSHTVVIVGTIHMGSGPETRLRSETKDHIYSSDKVYLELASSDLAGAYFRMMREGRRNGPPLSETLEPELWEAFSSFTQSYGLPGATIDTLEMWMISILLTPQIATKAGFNAHYGIEAGLYTALARADIQGYGLESVDDQLSAIRKTLANTSDAEIALSLMSEGEDAIEELRELELTWRAGNLDGLMDAIYASATYTELEWLLDHRNIAWFDYLQDTYGHREAPLKLFIAVGAGHLGGETGLLQLFADAGYEVTPLHAH